MKYSIDKKTNLFIILSGIFLTNALLAEILGTKIFSLEKTLNYPPAQININGSILDFNLTAGVVLWPIVFITTDIINEYFGKNGVKKITYLTIFFISFSFVVLILVTKLEPADFWLNINNKTPNGDDFDINFAFNKVLIQSSSIVIGSLIAFLVGQLLDVFIFHKLRKVTGAKMLWIRATGSTLMSQIIDSFLVLYIAFNLLAPQDTKWTISQIFSVGIINYTYKFLVALLLTPILYIIHFIIDKYLGKKTAEELMSGASKSSTTFF